MKYLVVQDWPSTHGNHAGMVHMCKLLKIRFPNEYVIVEISKPRKFSWNPKRLSKKIRAFYEKYVFPRKVVKKFSPYFSSLRSDDEIFLLEYLFPETSQIQLAKIIRSRKESVKIYGLSHLTPLFGEQKYPDYSSMVLEWFKPIDKYLTLGSSLVQYFVSNGIPKDSISCGFHYVDLNFYAGVCHPCSDRLKVIVIGTMARNYFLIADIVKHTPQVDWVICKGYADLDRMFESCPNVQLLGFMEEEELRRQMSLADVSVSVMDDTIGSNVVTTSMSMGLAQVVSDVGSIRDYCSEDNALFCENTSDSFVQAIGALAENKFLVQRMREHAKESAKRFSIENVHQWFMSV